MTELFPDHELLALRQLQLWKTWKTQNGFCGTLLTIGGILPSDIGRVWSPSKHPVFFLLAFLEAMGSSFFSFLQMLRLGRDVPASFYQWTQYHFLEDVQDLQDLWTCPQPLCAWRPVEGEQQGSRECASCLHLLIDFVKMPGSLVPLCWGWSTRGTSQL